MGTIIAIFSSSLFPPAPAKLELELEESAVSSTTSNMGLDENNFKGTIKEVILKPY